jgi:hypothetical protein
MRNLLVEKWEARLKQVFDEIDHAIEDRFGALYPLHPSRSPRERAANPEDGGLFDVTPAFTAGMGSSSGPGYFFRIRWATLSPVSEAQQRLVEDVVLTLLEQKLPLVFPGRQLTIARDGIGYKIIGDLSLE